MPRFDPLPERRPAIVAGASSGIGEATAIELAAHGFPVALGARRVEKLNDIVGKINAEGGEAVGFHLDVTDPNSVKSFVAQSVEALGDIEVLVTGAGDTYFGKLAEITTDEFRIAAADSPRRRQPACRRGVARHARPPARRPDLCRLRRGPAPTAAHGCLWRGQSGAGGDGRQLSDGARGHRRAGLDCAPRPDEDLDGLEPAGREDRPCT